MVGRDEVERAICYDDSRKCRFDETQSKMVTRAVLEFTDYREPGGKPLSDRRERFAQSVAAGASQSAAYASAGYAADPSNAAKLAKAPEVADRIEWLYQRTNAQLGEVFSKRAFDEAITREWVMVKLKQNALQALGEIPFVRRVIRNGRAHQEQVTVHNPAAANRALELLGQQLGMFCGGEEQRPAPASDVPKSVADPRIILQLERYRRKACDAAEDKPRDL